MPRTIESAVTVKVGDIFVLDPEGTNPDFIGIRGTAIQVTIGGVLWKTIDPLLGHAGAIFRLGYEEHIRYERLVRCTPRSRANILGWFPKKIEADDTIADVDWNPYE